MFVASNTSPISNLAIIGRLPLLQSQFQKVWIPSAVQAELNRLPNRAALTAIQRGIADGWIQVQVLRDDKVARMLSATLDPGEAEAIALALEQSADLILLDERDARRAAEHAGLKLTGVLGVLLRARFVGDIPCIRPEIEKLRTQARFFVSPQLEQAVLATAGE
jgi:uncharacterized protein